MELRIKRGISCGQVAGFVLTPARSRACERTTDAYRRCEAQMESTFKDLAEERSADPEIQSRIVRELCKLVFASTRGS